MINKNNETTPIEDNDFALNDPVLQAIFALDKVTSSDEGEDYKTLYYGLFRGISLIIENTNTYEQTVEALKVLQYKAEDYYISQG